MTRSAFGDLRLNHLSHDKREIFWPSFADIMMVVLMIFLVVMQVLFVKNWTMVGKLNQAEASEKASLQLAQALERDKGVLEQKLIAAETRMESLGNQLSARDQQIARLQNDRDRAAGEIQAFTQTVTELTTSKTILQGQIARLETTLLQSEQTLQSQRIRNQALDEQAATLLADNNFLKEENEILYTKYKNLMHWSRSSEGKVVIEIIYSKTAASQSFFVREPSQEEPREVNEIQLHEILSALKKRYVDKLFIKMIFPEDCIVTYAEASQLTTNILEQYDYYFQ